MSAVSGTVVFRQFVARSSALCYIDCSGASLSAHVQGQQVSAVRVSGVLCREMLCASFVLCVNNVRDSMCVKDIRMTKL
jgi:hypothetical protein